MKLQARLIESEGASAGGDHKRKEDAKSTMMPRSFEVVAQGSLFAWSVCATTYSELDEATFHAALAGFLYRARVGGKKGTGHGRLGVLWAGEAPPLSMSERARPVNPKALTSTGGDLFRAHIRSRAEGLKAWLSKVDA